jgi:hypothetical protein
MKSLCRFGFGTIGMALFLPALAAADERGAFVSLDREGTTNAVGLDASAVFSQIAGPDVGLREDLWGRLVAPSGLGVYGQLAVSQTFDHQDKAALSNVEVGGLYVVPISGVGDLSLRLGVGLPTAARDDGGALETNLVGALGRLQDIALSLPYAVWVRPAVGLRLGDCRLFAQLSVGADVPIETRDNGPSDVIYHVNAGVGTTQGPVALAVELATIGITSGPFQLRHDLGVSARYVASDLQPYIAYILPFQLTDDNLDHVAAHVVTVGIQGIF